MIKKKHIIVLALAFCLTATLFIVTSTGYDPWVDQDEDGDVDAKDLNVLAGDYGSTGNPTKNVSVTNWPEPENPLFPETLALKTAILIVPVRYSLIDETAPYLPGAARYERWTAMDFNTTATEVYNRTFICEKVPTRSYKILGRPIASMPFNLTQTELIGAHWVFLYAYLGKVSFAGDWTMLGPAGAVGYVLSGAYTNHLVHFLVGGGSDPMNITIAPYERLAIRFELVAYTLLSETGTLEIELLCDENEHGIVHIPIVENP